ncbi:MAG: hypothetical protein H7835_01065 [Magnetococcus sp. XQGC-1]
MAVAVFTGDGVGADAASGADAEESAGEAADAGAVAVAAAVFAGDGVGADAASGADAEESTGKAADAGAVAVAGGVGVAAVGFAGDGAAEGGDGVAAGAGEGSPGGATNMGAAVMLSSQPPFLPVLPVSATWEGGFTMGRDSSVRSLPPFDLTSTSKMTTPRTRVRMTPPMIKKSCCSRLAEVSMG